MASQLNVTVFQGNLTSDVVTRQTSNGNTVATLRLANNHFRNENPTFADVTVWGKTAELCAQYLSKGSNVTVHGRLQLETWESNGEKRSRLSIVAEEVIFGAKNSKEDNASGGGENLPEISKDDVPF